MGRDNPKILMDPFEFMLAPHSIVDAKYNSWGSGVPYAKQLLKELDYKQFKITHLMHSFTVQVYAQSLSFLLPVSPLTLHISLGQSMLKALMALLESVLCPVILMAWTILSLPTLEQ